MTQLAHRARFDLTDALTREIEVFADFFESAGFAAVESETKLQDFTLTFVERRQEALDLFGEKSRGRDLEGRLGRTVFDDVAEFGIAVFAQRLGQ